MGKVCVRDHTLIPFVTLSRDRILPPIHTRQNKHKGCNNVIQQSKKTLAVDLQREREEDAKREARRLKRLGKASGMEDIEDVPAAAASGSAMDDAMDDDDDAPELVSKKKKFGKVKFQKQPYLPARKKALLKKSASAAPVRASLGIKKAGIRKPSALMRKTLKKMAKKREMEL